MITDWFAGKEMATAMAIFVNSWPAGVALSLLSLPLIGTAYGLAAVHLFVAALITIGAVMAAFYRAPQSAIASVASSARLSVQVMMAVVVAGLIWGLFNLGFAMIFSFGPTMLVERGYTIAQSGSVISIVLWLAVFSIPLGGFVADRLKRPQFVLVAGSLLFALLMLLLAHSGVVIPLVVALGLISGQPAGPMMSLPARVLEPATRALGMGIFYTLYYAAMTVGPIVAGAAAKWTGSAAAAFDFGAAVVLACPLLLWLFDHRAQALSADSPRAHPTLTCH